MTFYINIFFVSWGLLVYGCLYVNLGFYSDRRFRSLDFFLVTLPDRVDIPMRYTESKIYSIRE